MTETNDIPSELIEPFAAMLVGKMWVRVERAKASGDEWELERAYEGLWWAVHGLERIAIAVRTATHFSIATSNHVRWIANLIKEDLGIDPLDHPAWQMGVSR